MTFPYLSAWLMSRCQVKGWARLSICRWLWANRCFSSVLDVSSIPSPYIHEFHATGMDPSGQIVLSITRDPCNVRRAGFWGGGSCLLPSAELTSRKCELRRKRTLPPQTSANTCPHGKVSVFHRKIYSFHSQNVASWAHFIHWCRVFKQNTLDVCRLGMLVYLWLRLDCQQR